MAVFWVSGKYPNSRARTKVRRSHVRTKDHVTTISRPVNRSKRHQAEGPIRRQQSSSRIGCSFLSPMRSEPVSSHLQVSVSGLKSERTSFGLRVSPSSVMCRWVSPRTAVGLIAALRAALEEAQKSSDAFWKVKAANRWINQLPGAWLGRWHLSGFRLSTHRPVNRAARVHRACAGGPSVPRSEPRRDPSHAHCVERSTSRGCRD